MQFSKYLDDQMICLSLTSTSLEREPDSFHVQQRKSQQSSIDKLVWVNEAVLLTTQADST